MRGYVDASTVGRLKYRGSQAIEHQVSIKVQFWIEDVQGGHGLVSFRVNSKLSIEMRL